MAEDNITEKDVKEIEEAQKAGEVLLDNKTLEDIAKKWITKYDDELDAIAEQANAEALAIAEEEGDDEDEQ